jgi:hypothetical protein
VLQMVRDLPLSMSQLVHDGLPWFADNQSTLRPRSTVDPKGSFSAVRLLEEWFGEVGRNADHRFNADGTGRARASLFVPCRRGTVPGIAAT